MKIFVTCMACLIEFGRPDNKTYHVDLLDEGAVEFDCRHGHKSAHILQSFKFELLAEVALTAIVDGYYREAVTSFTSALELFYEFYIKIELRRAGFDNGSVDNFWNRMAKQSERQFGAYNTIYLINEGTEPNVLPNSKVSFRNKVTHQGVIPSRQQAINYGQAVIDLINTAIDKLRSRDSGLIEELGTEELRARHGKRSDSTEKRSTMMLPTLLDASRVEDDQPRTIVDWLETVEAWKRKNL